MKGISFAKEQVAKFGLAEPRRVRQYSLEYGLQLAGRAADNLEHLGRRRLLLQCFGEVLLRLREFASAYFELPFQVDESVTPAVNARPIFRAFSRRGQGPASMLDQVFLIPLEARCADRRQRR